MAEEENPPGLQQDKSIEQEEYDSRLQVLLVKFLRETRIPFSIVENPGFQDIIKHLNPNITPPTFNSILEMAAVNRDKFVTYERLLERNEIRKKIDRETGIQNEVNIDIETIAGLNPSNFTNTTPEKIPLNLTELPPQNDDIISHYEPMSGLTNWPCVVCLKRVSWSKVRKLTTNAAAIFLYVCVTEKVYSLATAQKIYSLGLLQTCADHLTPVYEAAMKRMQINHPDELTRVSDELVSDVCLLVKTIKNSKYGEQHKPGTLEKISGSFRYSLQCFFKNYVPRKDALRNYFNKLPPAPPSNARKREYSEEYKRPGEDMDFPEDFLDTGNDIPLKNSKYSEPSPYDFIENL